MRGVVMVECPRQCGWVEPVGSLFALGPTLANVRADELRAEHARSCELAEPVACHVCRVVGGHSPTCLTRLEGLR